MFGFGKKKDPLAGLETTLENEPQRNFEVPPPADSLGLTTPSAPSGDPLSAPPVSFPSEPVSQPVMQTPSYPSGQPLTGDNSKDMEIIASKLDTLKAMLETLNQRMTTIEHKMELNKRQW